MVDVRVRVTNCETRKSTIVVAATAQALLEAVQSSRHFGPGTLEDASERLVSDGYVLSEGLELTWFPKGTIMPITRAGAFQAIWKVLEKSSDKSEQEALGRLLSQINDLPDAKLAKVGAGWPKPAIVGFLLAEVAKGPAAAAAAQPVRDWTSVFKDAGIATNQRVLSLIVKHFVARLPYIRTSKDALELYNDAARLPASSTKQLLYEQASIKLNGLFNGGMPARAVLLSGFRGATPLIIKIPTNAASAEAEADVAKALDVAKAFDVANQVTSHLVGPIELISFKSRSTIEVADECRSGRAGLVMPMYASTLEHIPTPMEEADVAKVAEQMVVAMDVLHQAGYAHCDVKAPNIFLDMHGNAFLGDYGAAVKLGSDLKEWTRTHIPSDKGFEKGTEELDSWLLAVTLLQKLGLITISWEPTWTAKDVTAAAASVHNSRLKGVFAKLLSL